MISRTAGQTGKTEVEVTFEGCRTPWPNIEFIVGLIVMLIAWFKTCCILDHVPISAQFFKKSWFYVWCLFSRISFLFLLEFYFHEKKQKPLASSHFYPYSYPVLLNLSVNNVKSAKKKIFVFRIPVWYMHWCSGCNLLGLPNPLSIH